MKTIKVADRLPISTTNFEVLFDLIVRTDKCPVTSTTGQHGAHSYSAGWLTRGTNHDQTDTKQKTNTHYKIKYEIIENVNKNLTTI